MINTMSHKVSFIHLRVHSEYSLYDSTLTIKQIVKLAATHNMPAIALTDFNNLFGFVKFYQEAVSQGIKPIVGSDINLLDANGQQWELCLLVKNDSGYQNLIQLISSAYTDGLVNNNPLVSQQLLKRHSEGLICLSTALDGDIAHYLLHNNQASAEARLHWYQDCFGDDFFLEIQRLDSDKEAKYISRLCQFAARFQCPLVATNNVRFSGPEDFEAHKVRVSIANKKTPNEYTQKQYFRSATEMQALFSDIPQALENSVIIARRCNLIKHWGQTMRPGFSKDSSIDDAELLRKLSLQGLEDKFKHTFNPESQEAEVSYEDYVQRLNEELNLIIDKQFQGYFLIVMDFVQWAKENGIPVGPGRGSGAGSLVAFVLNITAIDPIHYELLFERFLNPERDSMPDFDIDFCIEGRERVIDYVIDKYGKDFVSQIITFSTLGAKAVIRDVGRVQSQYGLSNQMARLVPHALKMTLAQAVEMEPLLAELLEENEAARRIWDMAKSLEGLTRNCSKHAGGVVISTQKLTDFIPLYSDGKGGSICCQFDKNDIEQVGLIKFDFLGLRNLTIIAKTQQLINQNRPADDPINIDTIDLDDKAVYQLYSNGDTTAVFQVESTGMQALSQRIKPNQFDDVVALLGLYRPGPLGTGAADDFINRKHGNEPIAYPLPSYQDPCLKPVLASTYGVILYQEQVMQIAQILGGYTLGEADLLRSAMGKKKTKEMARHRGIFVKGATKNGFKKSLADKIFDLMESFGEYGFNKSHTCAYALISYQTAWLKCHYPRQYMATVLSSFMNDSDRLAKFIYECRRINLMIIPPDINKSCHQFTPVPQNDNQILCGLGAIKGMGEKAVEHIVQERLNNGIYKNLFDFWKRMSSGYLSKASGVSLIHSGAMDTLLPADQSDGNQHLNSIREALLASLHETIHIAEQDRQNRNSGMADLFGSLETSLKPSNSSPLIKEGSGAVTMSTTERLKKEFEVLGFYLSEHPLSRYIREVDALASTQLAAIETEASAQIIGGWLVDIQSKMTKKGIPMKRIIIDDQSAQKDINLFDKALKTYDMALEAGTVIVLECDIQFRGGYQGDSNSDSDLEESNFFIQCRRLFSLDSYRQQYLKGMSIKIDPSCSTTSLTSLSKLLNSCKRGNCSIQFTYSQDSISCELNLNRGIKPHQDLITSIQEYCGLNSIEFQYLAPVSKH